MIGCCYNLNCLASLLNICFLKNLDVFEMYQKFCYARWSDTVICMLEIWVWKYQNMFWNGTKYQCRDKFCRVIFLLFNFLTFCAIFSVNFLTHGPLFLAFSVLPHTHTHTHTHTHCAPCSHRNVCGGRTGRRTALNLFHPVLSQSLSPSPVLSL